MRARQILLILALLALCITVLPTTYAARPDHIVQTHDHVLFSIEDPDGAVGPFTFEITDFEDAEPVNQTAHLRIRAMYRFGTSLGSGIAEFRVLFDGVNVPGCAWEIGTTGVVGGNVLPVTPGSINLGCRLAEYPNGEHTIQITKTVISGNDPIADSTTSVAIVRTEVFEVTTFFEDTVGVTGTEFLAWLFMILLAMLIPRFYPLRFPSGVFTATLGIISIAFALGNIFFTPYNTIAAAIGLFLMLLGFLRIAGAKEREENETTT